MVLFTPSAHLQSGTDGKEKSGIAGKWPQQCVVRDYMSVFYLDEQMYIFYFVEVAVIWIKLILFYHVLIFLSSHKSGPTGKWPTMICSERMCVCLSYLDE